MKIPSGSEFRIVQHVEKISLEEAERVAAELGLQCDGRGTCRYADGNVYDEAAQLRRTNALIENQTEHWYEITPQTVPRHQHALHLRSEILEHYKGILSTGPSEL